VSRLSVAGASSAAAGLPPVVTHIGRVNGPVVYWEVSGSQAFIPIGPCLVEDFGTSTVQVIWGSRAQHSATLPLETAESAQQAGNLVLLD
jgi:hypothetical protein